MKTDAEVQIMLRERRKGKTQEQAAARAGMHPNTARKYERRGALPSQLKEPRTYRTRPNPFEADWPWVQAQLERDPALQADTLFAELRRQRPECYQMGQLRTLQRHIALWRAQHGPDREVMFAQIHRPGLRTESDFTHMSDLGVSIAGQPFPHLLYHLVADHRGFAGWPPVGYAECSKPTGGHHAEAIHRDVNGRGAALPSRPC